MKKIISILIVSLSCSSNAEILLDLDRDITENIRVPVKSLNYVLSSKDILIVFAALFNGKTANFGLNTSVNCSKSLIAK